MFELQNKNIVLGVSGGIAAYKSAALARRLIDAGATVRVVMTAGAQAFIQPLTFQALTGNPVHTCLLDTDAEAAMGHIELARWADVILVAPASANIIARLAHGMADDLLSTICLATAQPIVIAPAMNRLMWANQATIDNCAVLRSRNILFIEPADGAQACGEIGSGRLPEPEEIRDELSRLLAATITTTTAESTSTSTSNDSSKLLAGKRILITAGPTREAIDPVRYISNHSSGKMGFALAGAALSMGARVTLVAGPVSLAADPAIHRVDVVSAEQMLNAVMNVVDSSDIFISVAAVSDYRLEHVPDHKIKKNNDLMQLSLVKNPDILKQVAALPNKPFCVGFAAETEDVHAHAKTKLEKKKLDMIAANHVAQPGNPVFGADVNALDVFWQGGHQAIASDTKDNIALALLTLISEQHKQEHKSSLTARASG